MNDHVKSEDISSWVERVAAFCSEEWGLPPITGRVLGWLMICEPAEQSAGQIADAIQASRASLTSNMLLLTAIDLVRKIRRAGERTAYYRIEDDAWHKVITRKLNSLALFGDIADEGLRLAGRGRGAGAASRTDRLRSARESATWLSALAAERTGPDATG